MSGASCVFCGGAAQLVLEATDLNRATDDNRFGYAKCAECGTVSLVDVPADLGRFYPDAYNASLGADELAGAAGDEGQRLTFVGKRVESGRLVEVGPGTGAFAYAARRAGFEVAVIDRDAQACEHLSATADVEAIHSDDPAAALADLPPSNAIVMWHVIEHLPEPAQTLDAAAANLAPGGVLAIATPNPESLQFRLFGSRWVHLDAPRHVALIPLGAVRGRVGAAGLRQVEVTTDDPTGRAIARAGWGRVVPGRPAARIASRPPTAAARVVLRLGALGMRGFAAGMRPLEATGFRGAAYTAVFVKQGSGRGRPDRLR